MLNKKNNKQLVTALKFEKKMVDFCEPLNSPDEIARKMKDYLIAKLSSFELLSYQNIILNKSVMVRPYFITIYGDLSESKLMKILKDNNIKRRDVSFRKQQCHLFFKSDRWVIAFKSQHHSLFFKMMIFNNIIENYVDMNSVQKRFI